MILIECQKLGIAIGNGLLDNTLNANSKMHFFYYHGLIGPTDWDKLISSACHGMNATDLRRCDFVHSDNKRARAQYSFILTLFEYMSPKLQLYNIYDICHQDFTSQHSEAHHSHPFGPAISHYEVMYRLELEALKLTPEEIDKIFQASAAVSSKGPGGGSPPCLSQAYISAYLNTPAVRKALHIAEQAWDWAPCRGVIGYHREYDSMKSQVKHIVDSGIRVLIYNGDADSVCNFLGDEW